MNKQTTKILLVSFLILAMVTMRILNAQMHIYNLVPIAALGIFSGSVLQHKYQAYIIPLLAMLLSDLGIAYFTHMPGFYGISQIVNYSAIVLVTLLGTRLTKRSALRVAGYTLSGSLVFFVLSNFGTFLSGQYGMSFSGLVECFTMAIPFYKSEIANTFFINSFVGDMAFSTLAFGIYSLASQKLPSLKLA